MLVASMNPCPCGYFGHPKKQCICTDYQRSHYMSRISGPLLDRIDLQIEVQPVDFEQMSLQRPGESSADIRQRVIAARDIQARRFAGEKGIYCNAQMISSLLHRYAEPDAAGLDRLRDAMERMNMSARAYDRILKVARTIADLEQSAQMNSTTSWRPSATAISTARATSLPNPCYSPFLTANRPHASRRGAGTVRALSGVVLAFDQHHSCDIIRTWGWSAALSGLG